MSSFLPAIAAVLAAIVFPCAAATEIPFQYRDGFLWVKVMAGGQEKPLNFLLDTGAECTVIDSSSARRLALKFGLPQAVRGVHSRSTAYRVGRLQAHAAGLALPKSLLALDLSAASRGCHQPIDGLLGLDFLRQHVFQIDYKAGKIRILDGAPRVTRGEVLPIKIRNNAFCVPIAIAGSASQWMRVDTGCDSALEWVVRKGKSHGAATSIGLSNLRSCSAATDVQIGARRIDDVATGIHRQEMFPGEAGLLGNALLSRFRVTVDAPGRRLILE